MAAPARRIWQVEQRLPPLPALAGGRSLRRPVGEPGGDGRTRPHRRHDRQHDYPSASLRSRHKKGAQQAEALGRSRGGFTTKLHARCDARGRPLGFVLTGGEAYDIKGFAPLMRMIMDKIEALLEQNAICLNHILSLTF